MSGRVSLKIETFGYFAYYSTVTARRRMCACMYVRTYACVCVDVRVCVRVSGGERREGPSGFSPFLTFPCGVAQVLHDVGVLHTIANAVGESVLLHWHIHGRGMSMAKQKDRFLA